MAKERIEWIDIAKAISITLVVLGHAGHAFLDVYLGWFRMPLFFFLSGILFKEIELRKHTLWAGQKTYRMMLPYFVYGIAIFLIFNYDNLSGILPHIKALIYGGSELQGPYGIFWFITVLLLTQLLFGLMSKLNNWLKFIIVLGLFIVGHSELITSFNWPWNANVVMISLFYYSLGTFCKDFIRKYKDSLVIALVSLVLASAAIYLNASGCINFYLNLKMSSYNYVILDLIIPLLFFMPVIYISHLISLFPIKEVFKTVGRYSIVIMYLHLPVNIFIRTVLNYNVTVFEFTAFGVIITVILGYLFSLTKPTRVLFLSAK